MTLPDHQAAKPLVLMPSGHGIDSGYAWLRLVTSVLAGTVAGVGMWSVVVVLPAIQTEFSVGRAAASLSYTLTMAGFALGGVLMGRLADRFGVAVPLSAGAVILGVGYAAAAAAQTLWQFALAQGLLIGLLGSSVGFGPLMADVSRWFVRRRGLAVAICASSNYLAGAIWPPLIQQAIAAWGWRATHLGIGALCTAILLPLALLLRHRAPDAVSGIAGTQALPRRLAHISPGLLQAALVLAGVACCVAMSMPQVHLVAYCGDLGYGTARGTEMLSLMLVFGIISRLVSGWVSDRIGGIATVLLGSALQALALGLYLAFDGLVQLYVISALFGLVQGGIVPSYTIVVRENFPPEQAGARVGLVLGATLSGMALGGWLSGVVLDATGSYAAAFANGIAWNALNLAVVLWLLLHGRIAGQTRRTEARDGGRPGGVQRGAMG
jgi:MFS family permease